MPGGNALDNVLRTSSRVAGRGNDKPPGDDEDFLDFARHLRTSTIHDAIRGARRVGEIHRFAFPQSRWRHFDRVTDFPRHVLPIGDAVCTFNPVRGQGMSVAAQQRWRSGGCWRPGEAAPQPGPV